MYSLEKYAKKQRNSGKTSFTVSILLIISLILLTFLAMKNLFISFSQNPLVYLGIATIILLFVCNGYLFFERAISVEKIKKDPLIHWIYDKEVDTWMVDDHTETVISDNGIYYSPARDKMLNFWSISSKLESLSIGELPGYDFSSIIFYFIKARTFQGNTISVKLYVPIPKGQEESSRLVVDRIIERVKYKKLQGAKKLTLFVLILVIILVIVIYLIK